MNGSPPGIASATSAQRVKELEEDVHGWFGLSYSSFVVLPRSILQSMPAEWQRRFVGMLREAEERYSFPEQGKTYNVLLRDDRTGRLSCDPLGQYDRGRRFVEPNV